MRLNRSRSSSGLQFTWRAAAFGLAMIAGLIVLSACSPAARADGTNSTAGRPTATTTVDDTTAAAKTSEGGQVTVKITWSRSRDDTTFQASLDTHSVDLDSYDLAQVSSLRTDDGKTALALSWDAPKGGHHRGGKLVFPATASDGSPLVGPGTKWVEIVVRDVAGVGERTFRWEL